MEGARVARHVLAASAVLLVVLGGCAKRETVKTSEAPVPPLTGAAPAMELGKTPSGGPGGIATETLKPEEGTSGPGGALVPRGEILTGETPSSFTDIHFDFDRYFIRDDGKPTLLNLEKYLSMHPDAHVRIEGNCDERGTPEYNMALGERRAESARKYLESLGVPAKGISVISFGKEKPLDPGHTEEAWAKNRRDHFVVE